MARIDIDQITVLQLITEHLRTQLDLNETRCYRAIDPSIPPKIPVGGPYHVSVALGHGSFETGEQMPENITEQSIVSVTGYSRIQLDPIDKSQFLLDDAERGLLTIKRLILKALVGHDPATEGGDVFVRQLLYAISAHKPEYDTDKSLGWISIDFGVDFDWDLTI